MNLQLCLFIIVFTKYSSSFNLNTQFPVHFKKSPESYFGFSVALHGTSSGFIALVGSPKSRSLSNWKNAKEPGAIFKCSLANPQDCQEVVYDISADPRELQDEMWMGMSLATNENGKGHVLACAPRMIMKYSKDKYFGNGMCFLIDRNLQKNSTRKINPLSSIERQTVLTTGKLKNYYSFGQLGLSAYVDQVSDEFLMGAPGLYDWVGSIVQYSDISTTPSILDMPLEIREKSQDLYAGYSVTSGLFFEHSAVQYALGAPRDGGHIGQVYICEIYKRSAVMRAKMNITTVQKGSQVGEYFGASVLAVNLNGDKYTDLVVGAPMYSEGQAWDKGRIHIFLSSGVGLIPQEPCTVRTASKGSRFGSALAALGDLNKDGYEDIAVGAPYENGKGAVYIFFGSSGGLVCDFVQRIQASDVNVKGPGFGMGISRGLDIDDNKYPDVLIGSYGDSSAVLFKSHPVVQVIPSITSSIKDIDISLNPCLPRKLLVGGNPCFLIKFHLSYNGKNVPGSLNFLLNITVDKELQAKAIIPRAMFDVEGKPVFSFTEQILLNRGSEKFIEKEVFIRESPEKYLEPVAFYMSYNIETKNPKPCWECPVVDRTSARHTELKVPFKVGCGSDGSCVSDLQLEAKILEQQLPQKPFIVGVDNVLTLDVTLTNRGEAAYATNLLVSLPSELSIINMGQCDLATRVIGPFMKLHCPVGNPFTNKQPHTLEIKVDTSKLTGKNQTLRFTVEAQTVSEKQNSSLNVVVLQAHFINNLALRLTGISIPENLIFNPEKTDILEFYHRYEVTALYSAIPRVRLEFLVPGIQNAITQVSTEASGSASCTSTTEDVTEVEVPPPSYLRQRAKRSTEMEEKLVQKSSLLNCDSFVCTPITCFAGPVDKRTPGVFSISIAVNLTTLKNHVKQELKDVEYFETRAEAYIRLNREAYIDVKTELVKEGVLPAEPISWWIIIGSAIGGLLLLIIIILILYKLGFFKRTRPEDEERKKADPLLEEDTQ